MTTPSLAVFTLLRQAIARLNRHASELLIAASIVIVGRLSVSLFVSAEVAVTLTPLGVLLLALFVVTLWAGFLTFTLAILVRDGHATDVLNHFPRLFSRCLKTGVRVLWHTWILAALIGSLTLFINPAGFRPSVVLLWVAATVMTAIRGPRAALALVIALDHPHITTADAITQSRHATMKRWPTIALLLAAITLAIMAVDRLLVTLNLASLVFVANMAGQALALAAIVELTRALGRR